MPSVTLHTSTDGTNKSNNEVLNTLPNVLHTPSGLAILELQGTIHAPFPETENHEPSPDDMLHTATQTPIGRLEFPLFDSTSDPNDTKWMKRVHLYVGKHQRLTGEIKKLPKPLVVVGRRPDPSQSDRSIANGTEEQHKEELEILEVIRHKIIFGGRPEPVGN